MPVKEMGKLKRAATFQGIKKQVTALNLLESKIIDEKLFEDLNIGKVTVDQVSNMDSVQKYLQGTDCIAGVFVQSTKQTMSIYEAKSKGLLTPGTSLVLLEAQAATGFIVDPLNNKKLSVEEAVAQGVVGTEMKNKLLSAEKAVTGYTDPHTGNTISLFQALKKDLIVKDHGIRLLEAQIATGGIIDPVYSHRVPVEVAYQRGYFDKEMNQILSDPGDDTKGFFDPNTQENLTYLQLLDRCVKDPKTGLRLLVIVKKGEFYFYIDEQTKKILQSITTNKAGGKYQGKVVSLWDLIYSEYIEEEKKRELVQQFKPVTTNIESFLEQILTIIQQKTSKVTDTSTTTTTTKQKFSTFQGIKKQVTALNLLESKIIDEKLFEDLNIGKVTVDQVSNMDSVQKYLQGTDCIAGVFVQSTKQTMSIYEAKSKGLLTPGTSLVLLEAQAATGFMVDPLNNKKLSVEEAVAQGVVGTEMKNKLLSAEKAVTGYTDPHTGNTISLFQALKKDLIVKDHGIRLLEAQIATGGIIDPVYSHRVPVEVAYQRGYFDEEMNQILSDPGDDTKGFFDPNTQENLTYLQLLDRCVKDPKTGLRLLVIVKKGEFYFYIDEQTKKILQSTTTNKADGKFQGKVVSLWDLIYSEYIEEEKRRDLVQRFKSGTITIEYFLEQILTIIQQKTSKVSVTSTTTTTTKAINHIFKGIKKQVSAKNLVESKIIDEKLFEDLSTGKVTVDQVSNMESVRKYLQGTDCIAGVFVQSTKQTMSIYEAKSKGLLKPGTSLVLLEAQAATGFMVDPLNNKKLSVEEAVAQGVVGTEMKNKLLSAEKAVTGYTDPHTGNTISLFQALKKDLIVKDHGIRLLEAQIATGGIIDPVYSHRVPVEVAYQRGYFDEEMNQILSDPGDDTKGFFDPNTQENLTYLQLLDRCVKDPKTGLRLLVVVKKGEFYFYIDEQTKKILQSTTTNKAGGKFQGKVVSLWDLIYSEYIEEEKKRDLVQRFKSGTITIEYFLEQILTIIQQKTSKVTDTSTTTTKTKQKFSTFQGIKKQVTALNLLESKIIDEKLFEDLNIGKVTVDQVSNMDSVQKYLQGTDCIAGVFVQSTKQTMSIYEAKSKGLLTPGTSLVLLEAQAATGFMVDPLNNKKLSVEEAVAQGVVGTEMKNKLLSAEKAVTGYTDPHTGNTISLFQALKKDLIVKDHGIRLLEAQIATGGIIDPVYSHRVPVEVAYQRGYFDEEMNQILSDPGDDTKGFFDPNTQENLTYLQLLDRCVKDPKTGLRLLVVVKKGEFYFYIDEQTKKILQSTTTNKAGGKFQGKVVSLWDLIYSEYIEEEKKRDLVQRFKSGTITIEYFLEQILTIIQQKTSKVTDTSTTTTKTKQKFSTFQGIKKQVTALNLLESKIIDEKLFEDLNIGKVTVDQVSNMDSVQKYLQGTDCIAGVFVQSTKQTMSIYEAKSKGLLTPGTSLVLLEAQAATGFMVDPLNNKKLSVEEAVAQGVVGTEMKNKLLSAEKAVTGYTDPHTGNTISLFQALKKDLIVKDHGIRLLEAQIATGGIIDPVYSHRVPVEVAYQRGYFDEEMNQILSDPGDDTKGFFDPNTQENLTYLQLLDRCVKDPKTGLRLLVIVKKGEFYFYIDEQTKKMLQSITTNKAGGKFQGKVVSLWDLIYSEYIEEEKKRDLVQQFKPVTTNIESFLEQILTIIQQKTSKVTDTSTTTTTTKQKFSTFQGIKKQVTALNLLESKIIDKKLFEDLNTGKVTVDQVSNMDSVQKYLQGTDCIAGVFVQSTKQTMRIYEAKSKGLLTPGTSLVLLEAQAATGFMVDPLNNKKLSVEEAVAQGVVGTEMKNKLLSAEKAVTGYTDPHTGNTISLFQAMKKDLIVKDHGIRLLEAQIATGGIIDPVYSHRVPVEVAYQRGYFDEEMNQILSDPGDDTKGFFDPNTQENLTYLQLLDRCVKDAQTGLRLLVIVKKGEFYFYIDEQTKKILQSTTTNKAGGKFQGKVVSLWDLIYSEYIEEEKRRDLVQQFKSGTITIEYFLEQILTIIQQKTSKVTVTSTTTTTTKAINHIFKGIKKQVSAKNLVDAKIIDEKLFEDLSTGKVTVDQVSNMDSVRKYLQGTDCIAGVFVQSTKQTMRIYEAKSKGLLTPGTSLVLLEAQAATGFMVDPLNNKKLSVEEAVAQGVVGTEMKNKLLSAEKAVTGYTDPHTGNTISLFQALKKDLIVKDHGIRLLEAQIATGGIIDPVYSHRVPVEVAYQRGYFDEEMNQILSDPGDDTKGFFDPNTQENLTYLQLLDRCVKDSKTGLRLLVVVKKGEFYFYIDEQTKKILQSTTTNKAGGKFQGKVVSLWDLIYSEYIEEEKKRDLVQQFKSGTITIEYFLEQILTIIQQKTSKVTVTSTTTTTTKQKFSTFQGIKKQVTALNLLESKIIDEKLFEDLNIGKVTVDQVSNMDSVRKYLQGTDCIAGVFVQSTKQTMSIYEAKSKGLLTPGTSLVLLEAQAATGFMVDPLNNKKLSVEEAVAQGVVGTEMKNKLLSAEKAVTGYTDPHTGNTISLFQALKKDLIVKDHGIRLLEAQIATGGIIDPVYSHRVPVEVAYQRGYFDEEMNQILSDPGDDTKGFFDPNTQENLTYLQLLDRCVKDAQTGLRLLVIVKKGEFYFYIDEQTKKILQSTTTNKAGGKFQGKVVSLWDLIYSEYIEEEKRRDLVQQFKSGTITIEYFLEQILTIIQQKTSKVTVTSTTTTTTKAINHIFKGIKKQVSAKNLVDAKIIDEKLFEDLSTGKVTVDQVSNMDSVRKYLQGTDCIAGVFVQSTKQTMSIYEAKSKGLLTPGTSLVLLEAQAATGFMVDPLNNKKLSVEEAVAQGVVGTEMKNKLLSAEKAVTGYTDPHTGNTISLFQALKKDLIVKDHGIRLLEAQIATGGIIDPVYSHRVPVEVAYQRGYFDEEMNQILSDPGDDTKGFFDPNTQENLTYLQLLDRCVKDPKTGLRLLVVVKKGEFYFYIDEQTKKILQSTTTNKAGGKFQGKVVSLWDLIYSEYIEEEKRRDLVQQFKSGTITIEYFLEQILTIIQQKTSKVTVTSTTTTTTKAINHIFQGIKKQVSAKNLVDAKIIDEKLFEDLSTGKVTVDQVSKMESVRKYLQGTDCIAGVFVQSTKQTMRIYEAKSKGLLTPGTSLVLLEAQAATGFMVDPLNNKKLSVEEAVAQGVVGTEMKNKLLSAEKAVTGYTDPHTGNTISLFQALKKDLIVKDHGIRLLEAQIATGGIIDPVYSHRVPVEVAYQRGYFDEEMNQILSDPGDDTKGFFDPNTQENLTYLQLLNRCIKDTQTGLTLLILKK